MEKRIVVDKKKLKKLLVEVALGSALTASCMTGAIVKAKDAYQQYKGTQYIAGNVKETGIFPEHLSIRDDSIAGPIFMYKDASGQYKRIYDVDSFVNDMAVEAYDDHGITPDQMAIAWEYLYGYKGEIRGATEKGMKIEKMEAFYDWQSEEYQAERNNGKGSK